MSSDGPTTVAERLAAARHSRDLRVDERRCGDVDYLAASGMASRSLGVGGSLIHLQAGAGPVAMSAAADSVKRLVRSMDARKGWRLKGEAVDRVAQLSLLHHIAPACPTCNGRKYVETPGTGRLSSCECGHCHGTGVRPLGRKHKDEISAVLAELARIEDAIQRSIARIVR